MPVTTKTSGAITAKIGITWLELIGGAHRPTRRNESTMNDLLARLAEPFEPKHLTWKPGATKADKCMALAYADLRAYMERLDEVVGTEWGCAYEPWGDNRLIARLTVAGITRSSTGEFDTSEEKNGNGGTIAEAQAFKRAAAMFGLGRFLYELPSPWVDFDPQRKRITESGLADLKSRYEKWYAKTVAATAAKHTLPAPVPVRVVDTATGEITSPTATEPAVNPLPVETPHKRMFGQLSRGFGKEANDVRPWMIERWTREATPTDARNSATELSDKEKELLAEYIRENLAALQRAWRSYKAAQMQATDPLPEEATAKSRRKPVTA